MSEIQSEYWRAYNAYLDARPGDRAARAAYFEARARLKEHQNAHEAEQDQDAVPGVRPPLRLPLL